MKAIARGCEVQLRALPADASHRLHPCVRLRQPNPSRGRSWMSPKWTRRSALASGASGFRPRDRFATALDGSCCGVGDLSPCAADSVCVLVDG